MEMYQPTPSPSPSSPYVTYTDLTPFTPDSHSHNTHFSLPQPTFSSSILSELHDGFAFPTDPDLDPMSNPADAAFPQPLQDHQQEQNVHNNTNHMGGDGPLRAMEMDQWSSPEARQREYDEMERQRKRACQRQDRLWLNWTTHKVQQL